MERNQQLSRLSAQLFLDTRRLAAAATQVVQLGAAHVTTALDFDFGDQWTVDLEGTLDAFAIGDLANDETRIEAAIALGNHHTFKSLHALAGTFNHINADNDSVTRCVNRDDFVQSRNFFLLKGLNQIYDYFLAYFLITFCSFTRYAKDRNSKNE